MTISLALKYRPKTFDDLVEQGPIRQILEHQLKTKTFPNSALFTGPAGTGKTTTSRIVAREINEGKGNPIEIDGASNNGVDNIRNVIDGSKFKSLSGEYKCYIIDECFHSSTLITTPQGKKPIKDIHVGDTVYNMLGTGIVTNVFINKVPTTELVCVKLTNGHKIYTTRNHLFFTDSGWVCAQYLHKGESLYVHKKMYNLWQGVPNKKKGCQIMQRPTMLEKTQSGMHTESKKTCTTCLCDLWENNGAEALRQKKDMLYGMQEQVNFYNRKTDMSYTQGYERYSQQSDKIIEKQSNDECKQHSKNGKYQQSQGCISEISSKSWRKWTYNQVPAITMGQFGWGTLDIGVCHLYKNGEEFGVSYQLQSRPSLSREVDSCRGGWQMPSIEKRYITGYKKDGITEQVRVDSIEIYKPGYNEQCFTDCFTDNELCEPFVDMYDLEVSGHPSYYVQDVLVHNCHMLSIGAWNAMLKLLEEPPAQTIFLLCTTDPQKIPATILSRVQRYDFQKISFKGVVDRLKYILDSEMVSENELGITSYQMEALEYIAKVANGGMRDAITLLDKCLSYATDLTVESTIKALGTVNYDLLFNLLESLYNKQEKSVIDILEQTYKEGIDLKLFLKNFLQFILELCKYDTCRDFSYVYIPNTYASKLDGYPKDIYVYCRKLLNSLVQWNSEIKWETNPKTLLESRFMLELINDNRSN